jgi:hypothetical protein
MPIQQKPPDIPDTRLSRPPDIPDDIPDPVDEAKKFLQRPDVTQTTTAQPTSSDSKNWFLRAWQAANQPLTDWPSRMAKKLDDAGMHTMPAGPINVPMTFAGDVLSSLTAPFNLGTAALTGGESIAGKAGLSGLETGLNVVSRALSAPVAAEGLHTMYSDPTWSGKAKGGLQAILGALGVMHGGSAGGGKTAKLAEEVPSNVDVNTGEIFDTPVTAPNPTAGTPQFGGKGKVTGSRQVGDTISVKAGEGLDKVKELAQQGYKFSHQNPDGSYQFVNDGKPIVTESAVNRERPTRSSLGPQTDTRKGGVISEIASLPRSIMASTDMSAAFRQGFPLIHKKEFWQAIPDLVRAFGSEETFNAVQETIANKPLFKERINTLNDGTIEKLPSFAHDAGLKLTDLHDLSNREEMLQSSWAEKIPLFGKLYRASERSYVAFLNKLRADTFESLINNGKIFGVNGETNLPAARALADFVNTSTGRGSLDFRVKIGGSTIGANLEPAAQVLGNTFFAPRLMASRMRMLNPAYYAFAPKAVRMERLKSLAAMTAAGNTFIQLVKMIPGATAETNPNSSDFGKVKVGSVHLDPWAGFQQYVVAFNRLLRPELAHIGEPTDTGIAPVDLATGYLAAPGGHMKSSMTGNDYALGSLPVGSDKLKTAERFARYKLNPALSTAIDLWLGKDANGNKVNVPEELVSKFVPIFLQDLKQLATENPNLLPNFADLHGNQDSYDEFHIKNLAAAPYSWFGGGVQQYTAKR